MHRAGRAPPLRKVENVGCVFSEREAKQAHTDPHPTKNRKSCSVFTGRQTDKLFKSQEFGENCRFLRYKSKFIRACLNGYDKRLYLHIHTDGINYSADNTAKEGNI